ncbi:MAG: hypothetical protein IPH44_07430 [Myxococcales bacterium]|nr:hypothetical protein [Myxococcales bacterium]MBP6847582.1 hypothetical protein [Kofleriaceae bacterium]
MQRPALALAALLAAACTDTTGGPDPTDPSDDPFAAQADTSEGLTNVSADLDAVLEHGALATACADAAARPTDRRLRLLCGKAMFFDESFGTPGIPRPILAWLVQHFPEQVGPGFAQLGMIADPRSPDGLPLGLPAGPRFGSVDAVSFGCASCHFGRLPDGRYAVGAANHAYAYGRMNLMMVVLPSLAIPGADPASHDPDAIAAIQPLRDRMAAHPEIGNALITALLPLITGGGGAMPMVSRESEHWYASWRSGTMDFFIQPLPFDDGVHTVSKISPLWAVPDDAELAAAGIDTAMLGWTGGTASLHNFLAAFVDLGGGDLGQWPRERLAPLAEYIASLRAPLAPTPPPAADVARGRAVFVAAGCQACHGGPRGMGDRTYGFDEIGTDAAIEWWADGADHDGAPAGGLRFQPGDTITHAIKSPRLVGLWAMTRFLHNGALDSLDQLLCLAPRPDVPAPAFGSGGHTFGCELPDADRRALVAYLNAH